MSNKELAIDFAHVANLIEKAGKAESANEALHFSQAALNLANAIFCLSNLEGSRTQ